MKTFLANTFAKWFKRLGFAGALRWRMLYWAYKLWPGLHIRDAEWDFVLDYLPKLDEWQEVKVLDVGATSSLFIYEIARRGYKTYGLDIRFYQEKLPININFIIKDITQKHKFVEDWDFIICISVLEHIKYPSNALYTMALNLKMGGRLLLTIPTNEFAQGHQWQGFNYQNIKQILPYCLHINEYTERKGQICLALEKIYGMVA